MSKKRQKQQPKPVRHRTKDVTVIRYSETTGRAVWLYQGTSKEGARKAYERVGNKEISRVRWWKNRIKRRAARIKAFLEKLIDALPMIGGMTQAQRKAIRELQSQADNPPPCDTALYNHVRRERRKRKKRKEEQQRRKEQK
jgi:hypothetical protein